MEKNIVNSGGLCQLLSTAVTRFNTTLRRFFLSSVLQSPIIDNCFYLSYTGDDTSLYSNWKLKLRFYYCLRSMSTDINVNFSSNFFFSFSNERSENILIEKNNVPYWRHCRGRMKDSRRKWKKKVARWSARQARCNQNKFFELILLLFILWPDVNSWI